jgi:hypothetical protein
MVTTRTQSAEKSSSTMRKRGSKKASPSKRTDVVDTKKEQQPGPEVWTFKLRCRYWLGFALGAIACAGTVITYQQDDNWKAAKFVFWMLVSLAGLYFNETRPGKKYWYDQNGRIMHV